MKVESSLPANASASAPSNANDLFGRKDTYAIKTPVKSEDIQMVDYSKDDRNSDDDMDDLT